MPDERPKRPQPVKGRAWPQILSNLKSLLETGRIAQDAA